ncbi:GntR family transcriptional regulator [Fulvimarina sp. MAC3]|uniref:GntR family transcriptional regulator n=1 Tax=Fulvimarina sp. MAC3 TaxID=3148887 RepID=UPI0031FC0C96
MQGSISGRDEEDCAAGSAGAGLEPRGRKGAGPSIDLTAQAYEQIEELFVSFRIAPGSSLRTQDIQSLVGLGRTPVHQAIRRLAAETLFEVRPRNGLRVAPIDLARERHLAILRRDLMRFVTEAAMRNLTPNTRSRIHYLRRELLSPDVPMTVDRFNGIDKSFDILLIQASGERFLERTLRPLHAIARRTGYLHLTQIGGAAGLASTVERHVAIMDAILSDDFETARSTCDDLIAFGIAMIEALEDKVDPQWLDAAFAPLSASAPGRASLLTAPKAEETFS